MLFRKKEKIDKLATMGTTPFKEVWQSLKSNKRAMIGLTFIVFIVLLAIFANVIAPYGMKEQNLSNALVKPNFSHWMGTDELGRDVLSRIIYGTRTSISIGFLSILIALAIGGTLGIIAGYFKGIVDAVIMRVCDVLLSIPSILLAIAIVASFGGGMLNLVIAIAIGNIPIFARMIRSSVLSLTERQFIEAAHALGSSHFKIITKHIVPNTLSPIIVQVSMGIAGAILSAAGLGFIGLGLEASVAEWGLMLSSGRAYMRTDMYLTIFPGLAIMLSILSFNMLGDGIRDALDPKLRER